MGNVVIKKERKTIIVSQENSIIKGGVLKKCCHEGKMEDCDLRVIIPSGITEIDSNAFRGCSNLVSVLIGKDVVTIVCFVFATCENLVELQVDSENPELYSQDNCVIRTEAQRMIIGCKTSKIPSDGSVTTIWSAFWRCAGLTRIEVPEGITYISGHAFYECPNLEEIFLPKSLRTIGYPKASWGSNRLKRIFYAGTQEEWYQIKGHDHVEHFITCVDGTICPA